MNQKPQLIGVRAGKGDSKWCSSVGHLPAWKEWGMRESFAQKGGKGLLFRDNYIICLNILTLAFFFFYIFFNPFYILHVRCHLLSCPTPILFILRFYFELDDIQCYKTFFSSLHSLLLPSLQALTHRRLEFTQNPFNHPFAFLTLPFCSLQSQSSSVLLFPLLSCEELENIAKH